MSDRSIHSAAALLVPLSMVVMLLLSGIPYNPELPKETEINYPGGMIQDTIMVKDIDSGGSGNPSNFAVMGNTLYFTANDGTNGNELWKSDGTTSGTMMVTDIHSGVASSSPTELTVMDNTLYFTANDGTNGNELWKSDGTTSGTMMVTDIYSGVASSSPTELTVMGTSTTESLYFQANGYSAAGGGGGVELWKSDGTTSGTMIVKDINSGSADSSPTELTVVGSTLFFSAEDSVGRELWKSDGTTSGTVMVKNIWTGSSGPGDGDPKEMISIGNILYFQAESYDIDGNGALDGVELWKSDGTTSGTVRVKDINSNTNGSSSPEELTVIGSTFYFQADDGNNGVELWKSDGTTSGTEMVKDIKVGAGSGALGGLTVVGNTLYFVAIDGTHGSELWKSDGTANGTMMVKDISDFDTNCNCNPGGLVVDAALMPIGNSIFFSANDGDNGQELWKSDGTGAGTVIVKDIFPNDPTGAIKSSFPTDFIVMDSTLYFRANDGTNGAELWKVIEIPEDAAAATVEAGIYLTQGTGAIVGVITNLTSVTKDWDYTIDWSFEYGSNGTEIFRYSQPYSYFINTTTFNNTWSYFDYSSLAQDVELCLKVSVYNGTSANSSYFLNSDTNCILSPTWNNFTLVGGEGVGAGIGNSIAFDSNGYPHVSYYDDSAGRGWLRYMHYDGNGWSDYTVDLTVSGVGLYSSIAIDSNDNVHIAYYDEVNQDLKYATYDGSSWSFSIIDGTGDVGMFSTLAIDSGGTVRVAYFDGTNSALKYASSGTQAGSWSIQTLATGNVGHWISIAIDLDGFVHIAYRNMGDLSLMYISDYGGSWQSEIVDNPAEDVGRYTSIGIDDDGQVHITYYDHTNMDLKYAFLGEGVTAWSIETIDSTGDVGKYSSFTVESNGKIQVSYYDETNKDLKYASVSGDQPEFVIVDSGGDVGKYSSMTLDNSGSPQIVYYDNTSGTKGLKFACLGCSVANPPPPPSLSIGFGYTSSSNNLGGAFYLGNLDTSEVYVLQSTLFFQLNSSSIEVNNFTVDCNCSSNSGTYTWEENAIFGQNVITDDTAYCLELILKNSAGIVLDQGVSCANFPQSYNDPTWLLSTIPDASGHSGSYVDMALDSQESPHFCYYDNDNSDLKYAMFDGNSWSVTHVDGYTGGSNGTTDGDVGKYCSIAFDSGDLPHISYYDVTNGDLKLASLIINPLSGSAEWVVQIVNSFRDVGTDTSLAISSNDIPHISYYGDGNNDAISLYYSYKLNTSWGLQTLANDVGDLQNSPIGSQTSLVLTNDSPSISYYDAVDGDLGFISQSNSAWYWHTVDSDGLVGSFSSHVVDDDGYHISYYDETNGALKYARYESLGNNQYGWFNDTLDGIGDTGLHTSMALNEEGFVSISYFDSSNGALKYIVVRGSSPWDVYTVDDVGRIGEYSSLAIDSAGEIYVAYYDNTASVLRLACNTCNFSGNSGGGGNGTGNNTGGNESGNPVIFAHLTQMSDNGFDVDYSVANLSPLGSYTVNWSLTTVDNDCNNPNGLITLPQDDFGNGLQETHFDVSAATNPHPSLHRLVMLDESMYPFELFCLQVTLYDDNESAGVHVVSSDVVLLQTTNQSTGGSDNNTNGNDGAYWDSYDDGSAEDTFLMLPVSEVAVRFYAGVGEEVLRVGWYQSEFADSVEVVFYAERGGENDGPGTELYSIIVNDVQVGENIIDINSVALPPFQNEVEFWIGLRNMTGETSTSIGIDTSNDLSGESYFLGDGDVWEQYSLGNIMIAVELYSSGSDSNDTDGDGVPDDDDNCPTAAANPPTDGDYDGDGCPNSMDTDKDDDDVLDINDNCIYSPLGWSTLDEDPVVDWDHDGCLDAIEDLDVDGDGVENVKDECEYTLSGAVVDDIGCLFSEEDEVVDDIESDEEPEGEWYSNIPVIGSQIQPIVDMVKTKYGKAISASIFVLTALGYAYRVVMVRSEMKMKKRMNKFEKRIDNADSDKELRRIEKDVEGAEEKNLLPMGGYGDLMSMIENREEELGLGEGSENEQMMSMAAGMQAEMAEGMQAMRESQESIASMAEDIRDMQPQQSSGPARPGMAAPRPMQTSSGLNRPSYHPKDMDEDGTVSQEDLENFNALSRSEQRARLSGAGDDDGGLTSEIVGFSKIPRSSKARCHCGSNKQYGKCHLRKEKCPCGSGKKFLKCCAKKRNFR